MPTDPIRALVERAIQVANGEACPQCLTVYPAPTDYAASVTCGACGFVNRFASEQEIQDDVNADTTPFHVLGKPRQLDPSYHEAKQRMSRQDEYPIGHLLHKSPSGRLNDDKLRAAIATYREELLHTHPDVAHVLGMILETT